ncbi:MAG: paraquat-inducible protein A [Candidatus Binatia bacterium]
MRTPAAAGLRRCHDCDLLVEVGPVPLGCQATCARCGALLLATKLDPARRALSLYLAALVLWAVSNSFPFMTLELEGRQQRSVLLSGALSLYRDGLWELGLIVLLFVIVFPLGKILLNLSVLLSLHFDRRPRYMARLFRLNETLRPWAMTEVFLLGVLVAYAKLLDLASIEIGPSMIAFVGLIIAVAAADAAFHPVDVWDHVQKVPATPMPASERQLLVSCHACQLVCKMVEHDHHEEQPICPRCGAPVHLRKPNALSRSWALAIAAVILYIPANVYPVMTVISFGKGSPSTILGGVEELIHADMWPLALLVFFASITVPVLKIIGLVTLLVSVQRGSRWRLRDRTVLYRIVEAVGRWSMIDIFMLSILVALVRLGSIATIEPGVGAISFAGVVVLTMFAAMSFDPRLLWDAGGANRDRS